MLLVREQDVVQVQQLLQQRWQELLDREGPIDRPRPAHSVDDDPPCPACGTAAPLLKSGACSDCGLQLA